MGVPSEVLLRVRQVRVRIRPHRPTLRVVVRRVHVQVEQVLGGVLANPEVSHRPGRSSSCRPHPLLNLVEPSLLLVLEQKLSLAVALAPTLVLELLLQLQLLGLLLLGALDLLVPLLYLGEVPRVVPVPPVPLPVVPEPDLGDVLVRRDLLVGPLGPFGPRTFQAVLRLVSHRPAVRAGALPVLGGLEGLLPPLVPLVLALGGLLGLFRVLNSFLPVPLVLQGRPVALHVPGRGRHELRDVGVDLLPVLIQGGRGQTGLPSLLELHGPAIVLAALLPRRRRRHGDGSLPRYSSSCLRY